jgi:DNA-binding MarR family transcriptional regulator
VAEGQRGLAHQQHLPSNPQLNAGPRDSVDRLLANGLDAPDFTALVTLRRLDQPDGVTQRQLMRELNLSSGTVSVRVERLADRGLVSRATDPADRCNSLISLTEVGHALFEAVTPAHIATENRLLSALSEQQRGELVCLLRTLLVSFGGSADEGPFPRLASPSPPRTTPSTPAMPSDCPT